MSELPAFDDPQLGAQADAQYTPAPTPAPLQPHLHATSNWPAIGQSLPTHPSTAGAGELAKEAGGRAPAVPPGCMQDSFLTATATATAADNTAAPVAAVNSHAMTSITGQDLSSRAEPRATEGYSTGRQEPPPAVRQRAVRFAD